MGVILMHPHELDAALFGIVVKNAALGISTVSHPCCRT